jgi:hypothetical protein
MAWPDKLGAFALTKHLHGSGSVALETTSARRDVTSHRGVSPRRHRRPVKVFLAEKGTRGQNPKRIEGKGRCASRQCDHCFN